MGPRLRPSASKGNGGGNGRVSLSTCALLTFIVVASLVLFQRSTPVATRKVRPKARPPAVEWEEPADDAPSTTFQRRIVAVGDLHGDLAHFTRILRHCGLIDLKGTWIGGEATLVQTGDIVDRGKDTIALYRFMDLLRPQAALAGGRVVSLLGNHEIMNAMGDWRYVIPEDIATFGGERQRRYAMSEGWIGQTWRANYSITARVEYPPSPATSTSPTSSGDSHQFLLAAFPPSSSSGDRKSPFWQSAASFVHGGITPEYIDSLELNDGVVDPIERINDIGAGLMESLAGAGSPMQLPRNATKEQKHFWSADGPMWDRTYALDEDEVSLCARAKRACEIMGVRRLIMGHTPTFEHIVSRCDGSVLLIDTGISRAYGGVLSALQIEYNLVPVPVELDGDDEVPSQVAGTGNWIETEVVTALYVGGEDTEIGRWERVVEIA